MADNADDLDRSIRAAATELGIPIESDWMPSIRANVEIIHRARHLLETYPLPDDLEPAPVFEA